MGRDSRWSLRWLRWDKIAVRGDEMIEAVHRDHEANFVLCLVPHSIPRAVWSADEHVGVPVQLLASLALGMIVVRCPDVIRAGHLPASL